MSTAPENLLTEQQAADFLAVSPRTLSTWRSRGGGAIYVRISARCIRYRLSDLVAFANERLRANTSEGIDR